MSVSTPSLGMRPKDITAALSRGVQLSDQNKEPLKATISTACKAAERVSLAIRNMVEKNEYTSKELWGFKGQIKELREISGLVEKVLVMCYPHLQCFVPTLKRSFEAQVNLLVLDISKLPSHLDETLEILDEELTDLEWIQVEEQRAARMDAESGSLPKE